MRISFDLDDTLIPSGFSSALEPLRFARVARAFGIERLRAGTQEMFAALRERDHSIWIYSSSLRPRHRIELLFRWHSLRVDGIVTFERHQQAMAARHLVSPPTKFPPAFGIDLHIDDAEGVRIEGERYGFPVLVVAPDDREWVDRIRAAVDAFASSR